ncbi:MAG: site-specific integrase [Candidatus Eremiobacteraeota bacterium]|nr:site-specific integrase [Candidatus Eremiobacteraeota bacterium]
MKRKSKDGTVSYLVRVFSGYDRETGKRREVCETWPKKKDAEAREAELKKQLMLGTWQKPTKHSLAEFFAEWIEKSASARLKPQTVELYSTLFRIYVKPHIGDLQLLQVSPMALQGLYTKLGQGAKPLSPKTIKNVNTCLRSCLKQAVAWRYIPHNPCHDVDLPRRVGQPRRVRSFDPEQAQAFLHKAKADRWGACLATGLLTGARPAEYLALLWSDLNWKKGELRIERTIVWPKGGGWHFDAPKTDRSCRTITLMPELLEILREHRTRQLQERLLLGPKWESKEDFMFTNARGGPVYEKHLVTRSFKKVLKAAEIPKDFTLYELRHTCATLLLVIGVAAKVVADRLGHSSVSMTLDTYSHVLPAVEKKASDGLREVIYLVP